jgi:hypothetical protein
MAVAEVSAPIPTSPASTATATATPTAISKSNAAAAAAQSKPPRSSLISASAAQLLKVHMDGIMDVVMLRKPYGCVVSVDRGGGIYVFH